MLKGNRRCLATTLAVISALVFDLKQAKAQDNAAILRVCIAGAVDSLAENDEWGRARDIKAYCACKFNRIKQGLMLEDCPKVGFINHYQLRNAGFTGG
jgi:hypothetical protein